MLLTNQLCISRFQSHFFEGGEGFHLKYEATNEPMWTFRYGECGGSFRTPNGYFTSPSYPDNYPAYADCSYSISQPNTTYLILRVKKFQLNFMCLDYLEVRDGQFETSPKIGKFCGSKMPTTIQTTRSHAWLR